MTVRSCSLCRSSSEIVVLHDFGKVPVAGYLELTAESARNAPRFPLGFALCRSCGHAQQAYADANQFLVDRVYAAYQATYSMSGQVSDYMVRFVNNAVTRAGLQPGDTVVEIGSNDGGVLDLLARGGFRPVGFEPATALAQAAIARGREVIVDFFSLAAARKFRAGEAGAKLVITRHALEHAFDPLDYLAGIEAVLIDGGTAIIEVPYLHLQMLNGHYEALTFQHISVFSVTSISRALESVGLMVVDVAFVSMDGGSMVVTARKGDCAPSTQASLVLGVERGLGISREEYFSPYVERMRRLAKTPAAVLGELTGRGFVVAGYGAGTKGQSLLNMMGLDTGLVSFVIDDAPGNSGKFVPGVGIPVLDSAAASEREFGVVMLTAPTHINEIMGKEQRLAARGVHFFTTIPEFRLIQSVG